MEYHYSVYFDAQAAKWMIGLSNPNKCYDPKLDYWIPLFRPGTGQLDTAYEVLLLDLRAALDNSPIIEIDSEIIQTPNEGMCCNA